MYIPMVIAGLMWQPDTRPMQYAIAITERPKARAVPTTPAGVSQPTTTVTPQPTRVRTMVPIRSATYFATDVVSMGNTPWLPRDEILRPSIDESS